MHWLDRGWRFIGVVQFRKGFGHIYQREISQIVNQIHDLVVDPAGLFKTGKLVTNLHPYEGELRAAYRDLFGNFENFGEAGDALGNRSIAIQGIFVMDIQRNSDSSFLHWISSLRLLRPRISR